MIDYIWAITQKGGWILAPIFLLAVTGWWLVLSKFFALLRMDLPWRSLNVLQASPDAIAKWTATLKKSEMVSVPGGAAMAIYTVREHGRESMEYALDAYIKNVFPAIHSSLHSIANLASAAPLLGLLGTVSGMVGTFKVIKVFGFGNPAMMADSIAEALMTTQNGLLVAVPLMLFHVHLVNRAEKIEKKVLITGQKLIHHLSNRSQ